MQSYSLLEAVYSKSDPIDIIDPNLRVRKLAEDFYRSPYGIDELDKYTSLMCEGDLLLEFSVKDFIKDNLSNLLQSAIGWATAGVGTAGSVVTVGAAAAPTVAAESTNDMVFFGMSAGTAVTAIGAIASEWGNLKELWNEMRALSVKNSPQQIYDKTKKILRKIKDVAKKAGVPVRKIYDKIQGLFRKLMTKFATVAGDLVAALVPIPSADIAVQNAITEFADDAFKTIVKLLDRLPKFISDVMKNPPKMKKMFGSVLDAGIGFLRTFIGKEKEKKEQGFLRSYVSSVKNVAKAALNPTLAMLKYSGAGEKILKFLKEDGKRYLDKAVDLYEMLYPLILSVGSALTMLQNPKEIFGKAKLDNVILKGTTE